MPPPTSIFWASDYDKNTGGYAFALVLWTLDFDQ